MQNPAVSIEIKVENRDFIRAFLRTMYPGSADKWLRSWGGNPDVITLSDWFVTTSWRSRDACPGVTWPQTVWRRVMSVSRVTRHPGICHGSWRLCHNCHVIRHPRHIVIVAWRALLGSHSLQSLLSNSSSKREHLLSIPSPCSKYVYFVH